MHRTGRMRLVPPALLLATLVAALCGIPYSPSAVQAQQQTAGQLPDASAVGAATQTAAQTPADAFRFNGKSFNQWSDELRQATTAEDRTEALRAMEAFAARDQATEVSEVVYQAVIDAWKRRQEQIRSMRFVWKELYTTPAGKQGRLRRIPFDKDSVELLQDVTHERTLKVMLDDSKLFYSWEGMVWQEQRIPPGFYHRKYVSATDGVTSKKYYLDSVDPRSQELHPVGFIVETPRNDNSKSNYHIEPVLFFARAVDPTFGCTGRLHGRTPTGEPSISFEEHEGTKCVVIRQQFTGDWERDIWVDPTQDFSIRRFVSQLRDNPSYKIDADYAPDDAAGWVPKSWEVNRWLPADRLFLNLKSEVTSYEINPQLDISNFRLKFPIGTEVRDARTDVDFIVIDEDTKRIITREERVRGATYGELITTESGQAGLR